ncbi:MAG: TetR/AcrR family transcriptional regulator [Tepidiformaceae bacterium]
MQDTSPVVRDEPDVGLRGYRVVDAARSAGRRAAIIQAAANVFSKKGYHAATMDDIAQEMGVSKGVLYYQFRSKEEVFTEILVTAISEAHRRLKATIGRLDGSTARLQEGIRELISFNLDEATPNHAAMRVVGNVSGISAPSRDIIRELQRAFQRVVIDLVREGSEVGEFDVEHPSVTAMNILTAADGVSNWFVAGRSASAEQVAAEVSEQLVRGILARD